MKVAVVLGTYNRRLLLQRAIDSVRENAGCPVTFIVTDGGSTDGSRELLAGESDVILIGQRGPLTGAVKAFNLGFSAAVDEGFDYVFHFNDDAEIVTAAAIQTAVEMLEKEPSIGEVAFAFDLRGGFGFDCVHGKTYGNFGLVRTVAGMEVARAQGDSTGRAWWNPMYRTYGADCEFGCWLWKLGWRVEQAPALQVHDKNCKDALRDGNEAHNPDRKDSKLFWSRWTEPESLGPLARRKSTDDFVRDIPIHFGCGDKRLANWLNVDGILGPAVDLVADGFDFFQKQVKPRSIPQIYWCHGPEHVPPDQLRGLLVAMKTALAPGGTLLASTIDFDLIYQNRFKTQANGPHWNSALYGETDSTHHPYLSHKQAFTTESLCMAFVAAGFSGVGPWAPEEFPEIHLLNDYSTSCRLVTCYARGIA